MVVSHFDIAPLEGLYKSPLGEHWCVILGLSRPDRNVANKVLPPTGITAVDKIHGE